MEQDSYDGDFEGENFENPEASFSSFSGTNSVFNQNIKNGRSRGMYNAGANKAKRATIQLTVENFSEVEQVYELFNSNNSISVQQDDNLYSNRTRLGASWKPLDARTLIYAISRAAAGDGAANESVAAFSRGGSLLYLDKTTNALVATTELVQSTLLSDMSAGNAVDDSVLSVKVSLKSTLGGNTYKRLVEKMKYSVIRVAAWKIQCSNEDQFQLPIAQKDFSITGASADDEFQVSSNVSSRDNNTKIVEIGDKQLLIDGDTRLSGLILPETKMTFTLEIDIINEITKSVFR